MWISNIHIKNYKTFLESGVIGLTPGFNVIVGQNNAGKTALIEALSLRLSDKPHRSLITIPHRGATPQPASIVNDEVEFNNDEFKEILIDYFPQFYVHLKTDMAVEWYANSFIESLQGSVRLKCTFQSNGFVSAYLTEYEATNPAIARATSFSIDRVGMQLKHEPGNFSVAQQDTLAFKLASLFRNRVYMFNAERLNISQSPIGINSILASNASNLAEVLNYLQSSNPSRFQRFNSLVSTIFPEIKYLTVPPISDKDVRILVGYTEPELERADLTMPLSESGTGIGQVLAIVYVVLTSDYPRTIVIDEPQSFLHPGAVRKLFDILRQFSQHQYIITTHSPTVVAASDPRLLLLVRKVGAESQIDAVSIDETHGLRMFLMEIGARLSDVFGADNILWVEGRTEELCFPIILEIIGKQPLFGTAVIGVVQTGDLESKQAQRVFDIYSRLSKGRGLLPPAIGFIFDQEGRTQTEQEDLQRKSKNTVHFLARRMYENYLLLSAAIASLMSGLGGFRNEKVSPEEVAQWIERHRWDRKYYPQPPDENNKNDEFWKTSIDGANLLKDIFSEFSENRYEYDKVEYGVTLTKWICENAPEQLREIAELIKNVLTSVVNAK